jgi:clan AA aspartic protease
MTLPMGTFHVEVTVRNLNDPARGRRVSVMVDTGATYTTLPRDVVDDLGCRPIGTRRVMLASGREEEWPIATMLIALDGHEGPTFCLIGPAGGPALLGAVTLEEFALGVDPVAKRLVPVRSYLMFQPSHSEISRPMIHSLSSVESHGSASPSALASLVVGLRAAFVAWGGWRRVAGRLARRRSGRRAKTVLVRCQAAALRGTGGVLRARPPDLATR